MSAMAIFHHFQSESEFQRPSVVGGMLTFQAVHSCATTIAQVVEFAANSAQKYFGKICFRVTAITATLSQTRSNQDAALTAPFPKPLCPESVADERRIATDTMNATKSVMPVVMMS